MKGVDPQQESQLSALPTFVQNNAWAGFKAGEQQVIRAKGRRCPAREAGDWVSIMILMPTPTISCCSQNASGCM
nr:Lipoprotein-releasing system transmembrane protein lolE [Klebsiella pneumoniae]